jgi:predicted nucleotidyltransferase
MPIFGSAGSGAYTDESDVDIIVIKETGTPFIERAREFDDIWDLAPAVDLLVYTPAEFEKLLEENIGFWKSVKETLVRVVLRFFHISRIRLTDRGIYIYGRETILPKLSLYQQ